MYSGTADPLVPGGQEQRVLIPSADGTAHGEIAFQRRFAGIVQIDNTHLVTLAQDPQGISLDVRQVQADELRNSQAAVEKKGQNTIIPFPIRAVHAVQQLHAFIQREVSGQRFFQFGRIQVLNGVAVQKMDLLRQVVKKGTECGDFPGSGRGIKSIFCLVAVGLPGAVPAEIGQIAINVCQRNRADQIDVNVHNGNLIQFQIPQRTIPGLFDVAEKVSEIQEIFVHRFLRVGLDTFVIG